MGFIKHSYTKEFGLANFLKNTVNIQSVFVKYKIGKIIWPFDISASKRLKRYTRHRCDKLKRNELLSPFNNPLLNFLFF